MRLSKKKYQKLIELSQAVVAEFGLEFCEVLLKTEDQINKLVIVIDKPEGIIIDDLARVSKRLSFLLDEEDLITFEYTLEVSSPGIFRELKNEDDLIRFTGKRVKIILKSPQKGQKNITGILQSYQNNILNVMVQEDEVVVRWDQINKINLQPEFK